MIDLHGLKTCKYFTQCPTSFQRKFDEAKSAIPSVPRLDRYNMHSKVKVTSQSESGSQSAVTVTPASELVLLSQAKKCNCKIVKYHCQTQKMTDNCNLSTS